MVKGPEGPQEEWLRSLGFLAGEKEMRGDTEVCTFLMGDSGGEL